MKHPVTQTHNAAVVYVDLVKSQAAAHISSHPHLLGLVKEVLERITAKGPEMRIERDMGRPIGYNFVIETTDKDTVLYAQPLHDNLFARFVKNGKPLATSYLSIILRRQTDGTYELHDTWIGRLSPPRPGSDNETPASKEYWANHAYVLEAQPVQLRTLTKVCPY